MLNCGSVGEDSTDSLCGIAQGTTWKSVVANISGFICMGEISNIAQSLEERSQIWSGRHCCTTLYYISAYYSLHISAYSFHHNKFAEPRETLHIDIGTW